MEQVAAIFAEVFNVPAESISPATNPDDIEGWDSLGQLNLVKSIERHFNLTMEMGEIFEIMCAGDIVRILERHGRLGNGQ